MATQTKPKFTFFNSASALVGKFLFFGSAAYVFWVNAHHILGDQFVRTLSQIGH